MFFVVRFGRKHVVNGVSFSLVCYVVHRREKHVCGTLAVLYRDAARLPDALYPTRWVPAAVASSSSTSMTAAAATMPMMTAPVSAPQTRRPLVEQPQVETTFSIEIKPKQGWRTKTTTTTTNVVNAYDDAAAAAAVDGDDAADNAAAMAMCRFCCMQFMKVCYIVYTKRHKRNMRCLFLCSACVLVYARKWLSPGAKPAFEMYVVFFVVPQSSFSVTYLIIQRVYILLSVSVL